MSSRLIEIGEGMIITGFELANKPKNILVERNNNITKHI